MSPTSGKCLVFLVHCWSTWSTVPNPRQHIHPRQKYSCSKGFQITPVWEPLIYACEFEQERFVPPSPADFPSWRQSRCHPLGPYSNVKDAPLEKGEGRRWKICICLVYEIPDRKIKREGRSWPWLHSCHSNPLVVIGRLILPSCACDNGHCGPASA